MKSCPFCDEKIQDNAIKCRFCKEMLTEVITNPKPRLASDEDFAPSPLVASDVKGCAQQLVPILADLQADNVQAQPEGRWMPSAVAGGTMVLMSYIVGCCGFLLGQDNRGRPYSLLVLIAGFTVLLAAFYFLALSYRTRYGSENFKNQLSLERLLALTMDVTKPMPRAQGAVYSALGILIAYAAFILVMANSLAHPIPSSPYPADAQAGSTNSPAYMLASLEAGTHVTRDDPKVAEAKSLLGRLAARSIQSEGQVSDIIVRTKQQMNSASYFEVGKALEATIPDVQHKVDLTETAAILVTVSR